MTDGLMIPCAKCGAPTDPGCDCGECGGEPICDACAEGGERSVSDLSLVAMREWIADWYVAEFGTYELDHQQRAVADAEIVPGGPISAWYDLRDELVAAYAERVAS